MKVERLKNIGFLNSGQGYVAHSGNKMGIVATDVKGTLCQKRR
jgi:hypothetical protein